VQSFSHLRKTVRFASLRKTQIAEGHPLPACSYMYRVSAESLKLVVEFLASTLSVAPGVTRDVYLSNFVFQNMPVYLPVYQRAGDPTGKSIHGDYGRCQKEAGVKALGKLTFEALTKLLNKRGECKTGLYVKLRCVKSLYQKMRTKLGTIKELLSLPERCQIDRYC
jgi:hypothetical protein